MMPGVCVQREGGSPLWRVSSLGARAIRIVIPHWWDGTAYLQQVRAKGWDVLGVMDRDGFSDWGNWRRSAEDDFQRVDDLYVKTGLIQALTLGNEYDDGWAGPGMDDDPSVQPRGGASSWVISFDEQGEMVARAWEHFRQSGTGRTRVPLGIASSSGQPSALEPFDLTKLSFVELHPYGKRPSEDWPSPTWGFGFIGWWLDPVRQLLDRREVSATCRLIIGELGISAYDADEGTQAEWFRRMLTYLQNRGDVDATFAFCDSDYNVDGYGAFKVDERPRPWVNAVSDIYARQPQQQSMLALPPAVTTPPDHEDTGGNPDPVSPPSVTSEAMRLRHAGLHWPENAGGEHPDRETIIDMPGMSGAFLLCSPSARWHWGAVSAANPEACRVWRSVPEQGKQPARLGWDPQRVADQCLLHYDEQPHTPGEWLLPLNELQFIKELGGPFPGYAEMANNLRGLREELQRRLPNTNLMFPAWVPSDDGDHLDEWRGEAAQWDGICLHTYGAAGDMDFRYRSYREAFPGRPIFVGEWNDNHSGADLRESLRMWADVAQRDPLFLGATYYIWETQNAGENDLSVWPNQDRVALFSDPPLATLVEPMPADPTTPVEPLTTDEWWDKDFSAEEIAEALARVRTDLGRPTDPSEVLDDIRTNWAEFGPFLESYGRQDSINAKIALLATIWVEDVWEIVPKDEIGSYDYFERMYGYQTAVGRMLGNLYPGDGAKYKMRGYGLTGRNNYTHMAELLGAPLVDQPEELNDPTLAAGAAVVFMAEHGMFEQAEAGNWEQVRRIYNGGLNGWDGFQRSVAALRDAVNAQPDPGPVGEDVAALLHSIMDIAATRIGDPYVWDGEQPGGFDCSGLIKWAYGQKGIPLTSFTDALAGEGIEISEEQALPGDFVLYEYYDPSQPTVRYPHVGLVTERPDIVLDARYGSGVGYHPHVQGAVRHYRRAKALPLQNAGDAEEAMWKEKAEGLIGAVGYLGGDVADRLEQARGGIDDYGEPPKMPKTTSKMTKADWQAYAHAMEAWATKVRDQTDTSYRQIGDIGAELRRVRAEFTG